MIIFYAFVAFAITYFLLRKSGGVARHLIAFFVAAIVTIILTTVTFEVVYPFDGELTNTPARFNAEMLYTAEGFAACVFGPIIGMLVAKFARGKRLPQR